jgi:hypothetical protein
MKEDKPLATPNEFAGWAAVVLVTGIAGLIGLALALIFMTALAIAPHI